MVMLRRCRCWVVTICSVTRRVSGRYRWQDLACVYFARQPATGGLRYLCIFKAEKARNGGASEVDIKDTD